MSNGVTGIIPFLLVVAVYVFLPRAAHAQPVYIQDVPDWSQPIMQYDPMNPLGPGTSSGDWRAWCVRPFMRR